MVSKTQLFWDDQATKYEYTERRFEPLFKQSLDRAKSYLTAADNVLDFGCATGTKTFQVARGVKQVHGLDYSGEMIKEANRKKSETKTNNCSFSQGTIFEAGLPHGSFDAIVSFGVIHLLQDGGNEIRAINQLLKPGGLFISTTPCLRESMSFRSKLEFTAFRLVKRFGIIPLHLNMLKTRDVENLIKAQGFHILEADSMWHGITMSFVVAQKI